MGALRHFVFLFSLSAPWPAEWTSLLPVMQFSGLFVFPSLSHMKEQMNFKP